MAGRGENVQIKKKINCINIPSCKFEIMSKLNLTLNQ